MTAGGYRVCDLSQTAAKFPDVNSADTEVHEVVVGSPISTKDNCRSHVGSHTGHRRSHCSESHFSFLARHLGSPSGDHTVVV